MYYFYVKYFNINIVMFNDMNIVHANIFQNIIRKIMVLGNQINFIDEICMIDVLYENIK